LGLPSDEFGILNCVGILASLGASHAKIRALDNRRHSHRLTAPPPAWVSITGQQPAVSLAAAKTICDGEVAKADAAASGDTGFFAEGRAVMRDEKVRAGCMAAQGWKQQAAQQ
jgi:hypothetical protein